MAKAWSSKACIDEAVETIVAVFNATGTVPDTLAKAHKAGLKAARPGLVQYYFSELAKACPAALKYLT